MSDDATPATPTPAGDPVDAAVAAQVTTDKEANRLAVARERRAVLMSWLQKMAIAVQGGAVLFSREPGKYMWEQTGFMTKGTTLSVKVGINPYQPIGTVDDEFHYPSDAALLVWCRDFALVHPDLIKAPFEAAKLPQPNYANVDGALSNRQFERLETFFHDLEKDIPVLLKALDEGETTGIKDAEDRILHTLKMGCVGSPQIEARLVQYGMDAKDLPNLLTPTGAFNWQQNHILPLEFARLTSELIRLRINDQLALRYVHSNELVTATKPMTQGELVALQLESLTAYVPKEGGAFDKDGARKALDTARTVLPPLEGFFRDAGRKDHIELALQQAIAGLKSLQAPVEFTPETPVVTDTPPATGEATPLP